jgi:hypothetical protein
VAVRARCRRSYPTLPQFVLHAGPYAAQVHRIDSVKGVTGLVGGVGWQSLDAGVVESHVQPAEGCNVLVDHRGNLLLIGHVTGDAQHLVLAGPQVLDGSSKRGLVMSAGTTAPDSAERLRGGQADARTSAGDQREVPSEVIGAISRDARFVGLVSAADRRPLPVTRPRQWLASSHEGKDVRIRRSGLADIDAGLLALLSAVADGTTDLLFTSSLSR